MHKCSSILFHCIDYRLIKEIRSWMNEQNLLGDCDIVSIAGASKSLIDDQGEVRSFLLNQIRIAKNLHQITKVFLVHHTNCGAYRSAYNFNTRAEERDKHLEDMDKANEIIRQNFPDLAVVKILAEMKDEEGVKVDFVKIE